jgi:type IV secretion system protein VirB8
MMEQDKKSLEKQYFQEARSWDKSLSDILNTSNKRAWGVAFGFAGIAILEAFSLMALMPLKTIEPFVIRIDNNTGYTDVVSKISGTQGEIEQTAQEALDKFFLGQYIRHREGYQWETREYDRNLIGLMSDTSVQQHYAEYTDSRNTNAPVNIYRDKVDVTVKITGISFLRTETLKGQDTTTALVRYTKHAHQKGERSVLSHWVSTVTYSYMDAFMSVGDRQINPLGFQVIKYRNDQETAGATHE